MQYSRRQRQHSESCFQVTGEPLRPAPATRRAAGTAACTLRGRMQGIQAVPTGTGSSEQSARVFASKKPKAFRRPSADDTMGGPMGLPFGLDDNADEPLSRPAPDDTLPAFPARGAHVVAAACDDSAPSQRGMGLQPMPRREPARDSVRDTVNARDRLLPRHADGSRNLISREASGNLSMNASVQLPGLDHSAKPLASPGALRSSSSTSPSARRPKSVLWALDDPPQPESGPLPVFMPRAGIHTASALAPRLEGALRASVDSGFRSIKGDGDTGAAEEDLQTQLNLLRERSWSEQQSLRRQLEDVQADKDTLKKELESANVRIRELEGEAASMKEKTDIAAVIEQNGSASALLEEKNAQIRHLENLARELASSGGLGLSLQAPSAELASGGGTLGSINPSFFTGAKSTAKEEQLQQELQALVALRDKEKEDLKDLEQVVVVFETKMEALKKENRDFKRQVEDMKSLHAHNSHAMASMPPLRRGFEVEAGCSAAKLERTVENMSIFMCSLHDRNMALGTVLASFCRWKFSASASQKREDGGDHGSDVDRSRRLEFQVKNAEGKIAELREEMAAMMVRHTNLMESEQAQGASTQQRLMTMEESMTQKDKEIVKLKADVSRLEQELDSSQRRLQSASALLSSAQPESQDNHMTLFHALEDDVASLKIVRTNLNNRLKVSRQQGIMKAVRDRDRSCLQTRLNAWRMLLSLDRHVPSMVFQANRSRNTVLKLKAMQQWFEQACLMSKTELEAAQQDSQAQIEVLKSKVAAERDAASSLSASHRDASARCEQLSTQIGHLKTQQQSLMKDLNSAAADRKSFENLRPTLGCVIEGVSRLKDEMDVLQTMFQCAVSENEGLREKVASLSEERDAWFEERARVHQRVNSDSDPRAQSDINGSLLRDKLCIMTGKFEAAELENSALRESIADATALSTDLQALVVDLESRGRVFMPESAHHASPIGRHSASNPIATARLLIVEAKTYFHHLLQAFFEKSGPPDAETGILHSKIQDLMRYLSQTNDELQTSRLEAKHQIDTQRDEIATLTSSLTLARNEIKYLQEIADGGNTRDVYKRSVTCIETFVTSLNKKFARKLTEAQELERQVNVLTRINLEKTSALESAKRHAILLQNGEPGTSSMLPENQMQMQTRNLERELEIAQEKMRHSIDCSHALGSEVQELTGLWRASANQVFVLNDTLADTNAQMQGLRTMADITKGQLKKIEEENRDLSVQLQNAVMNSDTMKVRLETSLDKASELAREMEQLANTKTTLEQQVSQLDGSLQTLQEKHAAELQARETLEKQFCELNTTFQREVQDASTSNEALDKRLQQSLETLQSTQSENEKLKGDLIAAQGENSSLRDEIANTLQGTTASNQSLTKRLEERQNALQAAQRDNARLNEDLVAMRGETDSLQDQLHAQSGENLSLAKEVRKLTSLKENMEMDIKKLKDTCEAHLGEMAELKQRLDSAAASHEAEADELREQVTKHISELSAVQKELTDEKQRSATAHRSAVQLEEDLAEARREIDNLQAGQKDLTARLLQLNEERQEEKRASQANSTKMGESQKQQADALACALQQVEQLRNEKKSLDIKVEELEEEINKKQGDQQRVDLEKAELQDNLDSLSTQANAWLAKAEELERAMASKDAELKSLRQTAEKAESMWQEAERSLKIAESTAGERVKSFKDEIDKDRQEKSRLESERNYLQERVQSLKSQLSTAQDSVREREGMIAGMQKNSFMLQVQLLESMDSLQTRDATLMCVEDRLAKLMHSSQQDRVECDTKLKLLDACRAEIDAKAQQLENLTAQCRDWENKSRELMQKYDHDMKEKDGVINQAHEVSDALRNKIQDIEMEVTDMSKQKQDLEKLLEQERVESAEMQESLVKERSKIKDLEEKLSSMQMAGLEQDKEMQACKARLNEAGRVMEAFHAEKEKFRLKSVETQRDLDATRSNLLEKESDCVELEKKLEQANKAGDEFKDLISEMERKHSCKNQEIEALQCSLTQVGCELEAAKKEIEEQKSLHRKAREEFDSALQALNDQTALVVEAEEKVESLREEARLKEAAAQDLVASLEQRMSDASTELTHKEEELFEANHKQKQLKVQFDALTTRCAELDEENGLTTSKISEYDNLLQAKGKELAKLHGALAEAQSLVEDADMRVHNMKVMEEKMKRELSSKDKQLRSLQQSLLDGSLVSLDGSISKGADSLEGNDTIAAMEKEYSELQERLQASLTLCAELKCEADKAKAEAADVQEKLQSTELQVVSLKLEIESKQGELDGLYGKVSRLEQALSSKPESDEDLSKAATRNGTAQVTPSRSQKSPSGGMQLVPDDDLTQELQMAREQLASMKQELELCQTRLREKAQNDVLRRQQELERNPAAVAAEQETSQTELSLQKQLLEKTELLAASEKKFAQLLAWVQKSRAGTQAVAR